MENVEYVRITNHHPECFQSVDIHCLENLAEPDTLQSYCDEYEIYVPNANEIYKATEKAGLRWVTRQLMPSHGLELATEEGFECFAVCETFSELGEKITELIELFNNGTYQFEDDISVAS